MITEERKCNHTNNTRGIHLSQKPHGSLLHISPINLYEISQVI